MLNVETFVVSVTVVICSSGSLEDDFKVLHDDCFDYWPWQYMFYVTI